MSWYYWVLLIFGVLFTISAINESIHKMNYKKRMRIKDQFFKECTDFDLSNEFSLSAEMSIYYEESKKQIMIVGYWEDYYDKEYFDGYENPQFMKLSIPEIAVKDTVFVIDQISRKILAVQKGKKKIEFYLTNYDENGPAYDPANDTPLHVQEISESDFEKKLMIIDSSRGYVMLFDRNIDNHQILSYETKHKRDLQPSINVNSYKIRASYEQAITTVQDEVSNQLILIKKEKDRTSLRAIKYEDIIKVSYEENGNSITSRSTGRTIGGALVGGAVLGGVGAVVGGLSGDSTTKNTFNEICVSLLLRSNTNNTEKVIFCKLDSDLEKTSSYYRKYSEEAKKFTNLIYVIIDKSENQAIKKNNIIQQTSNDDIYKQLEKLSELKERGILTEEEFAEKKSSLLSKI